MLPLPLAAPPLYKQRNLDSDMNPHWSFTYTQYLTLNSVLFPGFRNRIQHRRALSVPGGASSSWKAQKRLEAVLKAFWRSYGWRWLRGRRYINILDVEPVGRYALRIQFDDLHTTGIFSYSFLHSLGLEKYKRMRQYIKALKQQGLSRDPRSLSRVSKPSKDR